MAYRLHLSVQELIFSFFSQPDLFIKKYVFLTISGVHVKIEKNEKILTVAMYQRPDIHPYLD